MYKWENTDRKFGHCVIHWKIENYCFLSLDREWQILGPEFEVRGFKETKWIMVLMNKKIDGELNVCFGIQNLLSGKEILPFVGSCNFDFSKDFGMCAVYYDYFNFSYFSSNESIIYVNCNKAIKSTDFYDLCVSCKLFIRFINVEEEIGNCPNEDISRLSDYLLTLLEYEIENDVMLQVVDTNEFYAMQAHKPILSCRNEKLCKVFNGNNTAFNFIVDYFGQYDAWINILRFLYTANMKHIIDPPSEIYYDISLVYDIKPIVSYYQPDEIMLCSTILLEEFVFTWTIREFSKTEEVCLLSPKITNQTQDTFCQMKLYPKSFKNENITCISVEIESDIHKNVFGEAFILNVDKEVSLSARYGEIATNKIFIGYWFVEREQLISYLKQNRLILVFKIQTFKINNYKQHYEKNVVHYKPYSTENNYYSLSQDVSKLKYRS